MGKFIKASDIHLTPDESKAYSQGLLSNCEVCDARVIIRDKSKRASFYCSSDCAFYYQRPVEKKKGFFR